MIVRSDRSKDPGAKPFIIMGWNCCTRDNNGRRSAISSPLSLEFRIQTTRVFSMNGRTQHPKEPLFTQKTLCRTQAKRSSTCYSFCHAHRPRSTIESPRGSARCSRRNFYFPERKHPLLGWKRAWIVLDRMRAWRRSKISQAGHGAYATRSLGKEDSVIASTLTQTKTSK
jgi:hypothetical protein